MKKKSFPLSKVHRLLESGPVVLVTTAGRDRPNIMPMSWHTMIDFEPPLIGCVISEQSHTFGILKATGECVINIPTAGMAEKVVACGNTSGRKVNKFKAFQLTPVAATCVRAPLIGECYASIECRVIDAKMAGRYNFFILQGLKAWVDPSEKDPRTMHHRGKGAFMVAGETIKLRSKMK